MSRTASPLVYRPIVLHSGLIQLWAKSPSGKGKYAIVHPDGRVEKRKDGNGVKAFNTKVLARDEARFGTVCRYCDELSSELTVDHVIAWSLVGDHTNAANVAACCPACNAHYNKHPKPSGLVARILRENGEFRGH